MIVMQGADRNLYKYLAVPPLDLSNEILLSCYEDGVASKDKLNQALLGVFGKHYAPIPDDLDIESSSYGSYRGVSFRAGSWDGGDPNPAYITEYPVLTVQNLKVPKSIEIGITVYNDGVFFLFGKTQNATYQLFKGYDEKYSCDSGYKSLWRDSNPLTHPMKMDLSTFNHCFTEDEEIFDLIIFSPRERVKLVGQTVQTNGIRTRPILHSLKLVY